MKAEEIVAPGVERSVSEYDGEVRYFGTAEALRQAGLIARDCLLPGEQPGKRGVRWTDAAGRRWVLSKWDGQALKLRRVSTTAERAAARRAHEGTERAAKRLEAIDSQLRWGDSPGQFGYMLTRCVDDILAEVHRYAWPDSPCRGPWTLASSERVKLDEIRRMFMCALTSLDRKHDPEWRPRLERERALLAEDADGAGVAAKSSMGDVAALLARISNGASHE